MREDRTIQATIFEVFAQHEIAPSSEKWSRSAPAASDSGSTGIAIAHERQRDAGIDGPLRRRSR
jgi:hypothetical protein